MKNKTIKIKKQIKGGGVFDFFQSSFTGDNKYCILKNGIVKCALCANNVFMMRNGTIGKSKLGNVANDIVFGENSNNVMDISITCYFCSNCGNSIIIRDAKQRTESVYTNMVMPTLTDAQGNPIGQGNPVIQRQKPVDDKRI